MAHFFFGASAPTKQHAPKNDRSPKETPQSKNGAKDSTNSNDKVNTETNETDADDESSEKHPFTKEKAPSKSERKLAEAELPQETETQMNTRLNALLYHVSSDSVDSYKQENNSSDLLGRLYYDDYDSDSLTSPLNSESSTPLLSPVAISQNHAQQDYFMSLHNPGAGANAAFRSDNPTSNNNRDTTSPIISPNASSSRLNTPGGSSSAANGAIPLPRIRSFERGISFDTSTHDAHKTLTFKLKHPQFKFRRNNKTFLVGFNNDHESVKAIEWLFDEMIIHGDTLIILQVLDDRKFSFIDKVKAKRALHKIESLNFHHKKVSLVFEVAIGKAQKLLKRAIDEYSPAMMVMGTHNYEDKNGAVHHGQHKGFLSKSSISKHFLQCALVPVIVVKPTYQYISNLVKPIESASYFQDWLAQIDTNSSLVSKDAPKKRRQKLANALSPTSSRSGSYTNLASAASQERDREKPNSSTTSGSSGAASSPLSPTVSANSPGASPVTSSTASPAPSSSLASPPSITSHKATGGQSYKSKQHHIRLPNSSRTPASPSSSSGTLSSNPPQSKDESAPPSTSTHTTENRGRRPTPSSAPSPSRPADAEDEFEFNKSASRSRSRSRSRSANRLSRLFGRSD